MKNELMDTSNNSIWNNLKHWFSKLKQKIIHKENTLIPNSIENKEVKSKNEIIIKAKDAYKNYVLNSDYELGEKLYALIESRISNNKEEIEKLIEINKDRITYEEIVKILTNEKEFLQEYKKTKTMVKIDEKFIFSQYQVPVGIIGITTNSLYTSIKNIFKTIGSRNSIVIIKENYNEYSIDNLILLIVKEAIKKFNIDENIIQIVDKIKIKQEDLKEFDINLFDDGKTIRKQETNKIYIYQEDEYFKDIVKQETKKLEQSGKNVEIIKGEMNEVIEKINCNKAFAVCIYTQDRKKAYKFINLANSDNVFFNGTLLNAKENQKLNNIYFNLKNLMYECDMI